MSNKGSKFGKIWRLPKEELEEIVLASRSVADVRKKLGYRSNNGLMDHEVSARLNRDKISTDHFVVAKPGPKIKLRDILVRNSSYNRARLKKRLLAAGVLKNKCAVCGIGPEWNGKPMSLQLDHVNGVNDDNRLKNLRIICPNCHSQTTTYAGKNNSRVEYEKYGRLIEARPCPVCLNKFTPRTSAKQYCSNACARAATQKIEWPDEKELALLVWKYPRTVLAARWGVSDKAIQKRCTKFGIKVPPRGYWSKTK
jgi:hypothetical protein